MNKLFATVLLALTALAWDAPADAQEEEPVVDGDVRRCLSTRRIRRTQIIDDRNMLYYVPGNVVYHNILMQPCNGLKREGRFSYKTAVGNLCSGDLIFVLYDDAFGGLRQGNACKIGVFHPITREHAKALLEGPEGDIEVVPLPMPEPEEIGAGEEEPQEPEAPPES